MAYLDISAWALLLWKSVQNRRSSTGEMMGATVDGRPGGSFGDYSAISYNGNQIITGSADGRL